MATECFFGEPVEMQAAHPELYDVLRSHYGQDTAARRRAHDDLVAAMHRREHSD